MASPESGSYEDYAWRARNYEAIKNLNTLCPRTFLKLPMQDIENAISLSQTAANDKPQIQQAAGESPAEDDTVPNSHAQRLALEKEVANLKEKLTHEVNVREALKRGFHRSLGMLPNIPGHIPAKTRELLFEVAVLEEEVTFLEKHAGYLRQELHEDKEPISSSSKQLYKQTSPPTKPLALTIEIPECSEQITLRQVSEPVTPVPMILDDQRSPFAKPFPPKGTSASPFPSPRHDGNIPLPVLLPPTSQQPVPLPLPIPVHVDESSIVVTKSLNRKRVMRRGSSSSESLPTDLCEQGSVVPKPSRKKPNHKNIASLTFSSMKNDIGGKIVSRPSPVKDTDIGNVFRRLSAPKSGIYARGSPHPSPPANPATFGGATLRRSTSLKELQSLYPSLTSSPGLVDDGGNAPLRRSTSRKEILGRSPPVASPQLENKTVAFMKRASSNKDFHLSTSPAWNPSPKFEDKGISSIKRTAVTSEQLKFEIRASLPSTPPEKKECHYRAVTAFELPDMEKENVITRSLSDSKQQINYDNSLPLVKCSKLSFKSSGTLNNVISGKGGLQQRHNGDENNNFSENAKLYVQAKSKPSGTPAKKGFKVRPLQLETTSSKVAEKPPTVSKIVNKCLVSTNKLSDEDDDEVLAKEEKVGVVCSPVVDAAWLSGDLTRLFGTICSKIRRPTSAADSVTTPMVIKPPLPLSGGAQRFQRSESHQRSQSFNIRSSTSLKLLQECCTNDLNLSYPYGVHKDRRTEDLGPHRHYYKAIRSALEQKLKG